MSENAIDNETVLVKKQIRSTGISVWHFKHVPELSAIFYLAIL
jgi:hypothetical protein